MQRMQMGKWLSDLMVGHLPLPRRGFVMQQTGAYMRRLLLLLCCGEIVLALKTRSIWAMGWFSTRTSGT